MNSMGMVWPYAIMLLSPIAAIVTAVAAWRAADALREVAFTLKEIAAASGAPKV
jgi:hypothetical protein